MQELFTTEANEDPEITRAHPRVAYECKRCPDMAEIRAQLPARGPNE